MKQKHTNNRAKAAIEQMRAAGLISLPADEEGEGAQAEKKKRPVYGKKKKVGVEIGYIMYACVYLYVITCVCGFLYLYILYR